MNKKFVSGILLLIFSTGTINLNASLTEKFDSMKQRIKNSIQKVTLKDALTYTALVGVSVVLIAHHYKMNRISNIFNKTLDNLATAESNTTTKIASFEKLASKIQGNLIAQEKLREVVVALSKSGLYPHTETIEEEDNTIITQTTLAIEQQLHQIREQIKQIKNQDEKEDDQNIIQEQINDLQNQIKILAQRQENLQPEKNKNQEEPPKQTPEGHKNKRRKGKNKIT